MGRFDENEVEERRIGDPGLRRYWDDVRKDASAYWSKEWSRRRQKGIERRAQEVTERLEQPVELPDWLDEILTDCRAEFTPREMEALVIREGYGLSMSEAADAVGCQTVTFKKRYYRAMEKVRHLRAEVLRLFPYDEFDTKHVEEYILPLIARQKRWNLAVGALCGLKPK